jgi:alpha-1,4-galacturonosyltransferase
VKNRTLCLPGLNRSIHSTRAHQRCRCLSNLFLQIDGQSDEAAAEEDERISKSPLDAKEKIWMMHDQLIMAKTYLHFASPQGSAHLVRELKLRMKEIGRAISHSSGSSHVSGR